MIYYRAGLRQLDFPMVLRNEIKQQFQMVILTYSLKSKVNLFKLPISFKRKCYNHQLFTSRLATNRPL
jgi:hypothetical protein